MRHLHADRGRQAIAHRAQPPDVIQRFGSWKWKNCAAPHLVLADFGGDVDVAVVGELVEPLMAYCGLMTSFEFRSCATFPRATCRSAPTSPSSAFGSGLAPPRHNVVMSSSTWPQSPTMPTSALTFLLIEDASISTWILCELGGNASSRPVMRSSKRAPMQIITSQSCIGSPCRAQHTEPLRIGGRIGAEPHQVEVSGKPVSCTSSRSSWLAAGPESMMPPPA